MCRAVSCLTCSCFEFKKCFLLFKDQCAGTDHSVQVGSSQKTICLRFCMVVIQLGSQVDFIRGKIALCSTSGFVLVGWVNYRISHWSLSTQSGYCVWILKAYGQLQNISLYVNACVSSELKASVKCITYVCQIELFSWSPRKSSLKKVRRRETTHSLLHYVFSFSLVTEEVFSLKIFTCNSFFLSS